MDLRNQGKIYTISEEHIERPPLLAELVTASAGTSPRDGRTAPVNDGEQKDLAVSDAINSDGRHQSSAAPARRRQQQQQQQQQQPRLQQQDERRRRRLIGEKLIEQEVRELRLREQELRYNLLHSLNSFLSAARRVARMQMSHKFGLCAPKN